MRRIRAEPALDLLDDSPALFVVKPVIFAQPHAHPTAQGVHLPSPGDLLLLLAVVHLVDTPGTRPNMRGPIGVGGGGDVKPPMLRHSAESCQKAPQRREEAPRRAVPPAVEDYVYLVADVALSVR